MDWIFIRHFPFYALLGVIAAVPLATLVAALFEISYENARKKLLSFIKNWADIAPKEFWKAIVPFSGAAGLLVLLAIFAYSINRLGDATMPNISATVGHFRSDLVAWSVDYEREWNCMKIKFREVNEIPYSDRIKWEKVKAKMGKFPVRFYRTAFYLSLMIAVAGLIDTLRSRQFWRRGIVLIIIGIIAGCISLYVWVERKESYINNFVAGYKHSYSSKYQNERPPLPENFQRRIQGDVWDPILDCN